MFDHNFKLLLELFQKYPNMLLHILHKNEAFTEEFKLKLAKTEIKDKPYFTDVERMLEYYQTLINDDRVNADKEFTWNEKLRKALIAEKYMEAAKIRDYMKKHNYKIYI
jgi:hypothetical protein